MKIDECVAKIRKDIECISAGRAASNLKGHFRDRVDEYEKVARDGCYFNDSFFTRNFCELRSLVESL